MKQSRFLQLYPSSYFLKKCDILDANSISIFRQASNLVDPLDQAIIWNMEELSQQWKQSMTVINL